jgi:hypothetical protein
MKFLVVFALIWLPTLATAEMYSQCDLQPEKVAWQKAAYYFDEARNEYDLWHFGKKVSGATVHVTKAKITFTAPAKTQGRLSNNHFYIYEFNTQRCDGEGKGSVRVYQEKAWVKTFLRELPCICAED